MNNLKKREYLKAAIYTDGSFRHFRGILIFLLNKNIKGASNNEFRRTTLSTKNNVASFFNV
jgi:hypothetical protein